ncbi:MAG: hypothetical protein HN411_04425 [Waddliaceae bacterium]|jgi:DNA repair exonuclease SbcCD ATPase subunit|nr:hypothetical protein [Waddliaceae bacterium]MBT3579333.1 hypothetical protein [Waddliaceae bacterium]MBT4445464.1 hypothetical protein [Waddliaceae bacterium]
MAVITKNLKERAQFWTMLGPIIIAFTIFVNAVTPSSTSFYLPFSAMIGIGACWRWRWSGALGTAAFMFMMFLITYSGIHVEERLWQLGMASATLMAFAITVLSFEESDATTYAIETESKSRLDSLLSLDEKLKDTQEQWCSDREEFEETKGRLEDDITTRQEQKQTLNKTIEALNAEVKDLTKNNVAFHSEALKNLRKYAQEHENLLDAKKDIAELQRMCDDTKGSKAEDSSVIEETLRNKDQEIEDLKKKIDEKENDVVGGEDFKEVYSEFHSIQNKMQNKMPSGPKKPGGDDAAPADARKMQGMYKQLREQFEEKTKVLDKTRIDLFDVEGRLEALTKEKALRDTEPTEYECELEEELKKVQEEAMQWREEAQELGTLVTTLSEDLANKE